MEIVLILAGLVGLTLLIVPRIRRKRTRGRRHARRQWTGAPRRPVAAAGPPRRARAAA